jgi:hypothetical protein
MSNDHEILLSGFGRILVTQFDGALNELKQRLYVSESPGHAKFKAYLETLDEADRPLAIAQEALEVFVHDLMVAIEDSHAYRIDVTDKTGKVFDLKGLSAVGLHAEQLYWLDEFSKYRRISEKLV